MEKIKEHYNKNGFYYWLIALILSLFGGNWILKIFSQFNKELGYIIYSNSWKINEFLGIVIIISLIILLLLLFKNLLGNNKIYTIDYIILFILFISINLLIIMNDAKNDIDNRINLIKPFITTQEQQKINTDYYNIKGKQDFENLKFYLDNLIKEKMSNK